MHDLYIYTSAINGKLEVISNVNSLTETMKVNCPELRILIVTMLSHCKWP